MPNLRDYHIFISHSWDYNNHYQRICDWLNNASYFDWTNYSVPVERPLDVKGTNDLKDKLRQRISNSSCVIIMSGMYVDYSEWIDFEINTAVSFNKPIIGIEPWGQERVPTKVQKAAKKMVGWNSSSVIDAVRTYAL